jgi:cytochrome c peroxidase
MLRPGCQMPLKPGASIVRLAFNVAAATFVVGQMSISQTEGADQHPSTLAQEIADIEGQIDAIESEALAGIPSLLPGSPQRLPALGKILFFDKELSVNRNEACAFCHMPQTGFQGAIESINLTGVAQPGSVRTRFSLRKPPSAAYAAFSPPLYYADKPGEGKCNHCFIGGNFWDLRATGLRLQSPTAMQAQGSPLNPLEMANPDPACIVRRMSQRPYRELFESVWGPRAFRECGRDLQQVQRQSLISNRLRGSRTEHDALGRCARPRGSRARSIDIRSDGEIDRGLRGVARSQSVLLEV